MFTCLRNFCQWSTCPAHPDAKCHVNPCGGCKVEFVDKSGKVVNCDEGTTFYSVRISITEWVNTRLFASGHQDVYIEPSGGCLRYYRKDSCVSRTFLLGLSKGNARVEISASFFFSFSHSLQFFN